MFKVVKVIYGPSGKSVREGDSCIKFDFPANPGIIETFLNNNPHIAEETAVHRFKVKSDFNTPISRDQVEKAIDSKAIERLSQDQAAALCKELYYELFPFLKEGSDGQDVSFTFKENTDLGDYIRQVSRHWLIPIEGTTDVWLIRGTFEPETEKGS